MKFTLHHSATLDSLEEFRAGPEVDTQATFTIEEVGAGEWSWLASDSPRKCLGQSEKTFNTACEASQDAIRWFGDYSRREVQTAEADYEYRVLGTEFDQHNTIGM